jgi:hypothetical protein
MRRAVAIAAVIGWLFAFFLLLPDIKNFLQTHPLWYVLLAAVPGIALLVLAWFGLRDSAEANTLRADANRLRSEQNALQNQIGELTAELAAERNKHLQEIAENTKQPADIPVFAKGGMAYHAAYSKGSSERRTLYVYAAKDGSNSFLQDRRLQETTKRFLSASRSCKLSTRRQASSVPTPAQAVPCIDFLFANAHAPPR